MTSSLDGFGTDIVWEPTDAYRERSRLLAFLREHGLSTVRDLDRLSRQAPDWFWSAAWDSIGLEWLTPPGAVRGAGKGAGADWFPGGHFNLCDAALDRWIRVGRGSEQALRWEREDGSTGTLSFSELAREVNQISAGLVAHGIGIGDRVAVQLPLVAEAVVTTLALARIGAVAVPLFSGFSPAASAARVDLSGASAIVTADSYSRRGRAVDALSIAAEVAAEVSSIRLVLVVEIGGASRPLRGRELTWAGLRCDEDIAPTPLPASHPLQIAFTSGTTGRPKGVVLSQAGFAVKAGTDAAWFFDVGPRDCATWITDPGWIMFPITFLGGLLAGSAVAVYDGAVDWPDAGRLWRFVNRREVSMLGVSPTLVRVLAAAGPEAVPGALPSLRVMASSGEPLTPDAFDWLFSVAGRGAIPIINYTGGTEVSGGILANSTIDPIVPGGFAYPVPGMAADVVDLDGNSVLGRKGELVLRAPSPGMAREFWNDPDGPLRTYWSRWDDIWAHGDIAIASEGPWFILGRSDDTLKIAGKRVGPAEIEAIINGHPAVVESAAIGVPDPVTGQSLVVFVRVDTSDDLEELRSELVGRVVAGLGKPFRPRELVFVTALPKTKSGKIMRRLVRQSYLDEPYGETSAIDDLSVLEELKKRR